MTLQRLKQVIGHSLPPKSVKSVKLQNSQRFLLGYR